MKILLVLLSISITSSIGGSAYLGGRIFLNSSSPSQTWSDDKVLTAYQYYSDDNCQDFLWTSVYGFQDPHCDDSGADGQDGCVLLDYTGGSTRKTCLPYQTIEAYAGGTQGFSIAQYEDDSTDCPTDDDSSLLNFNYGLLDECINGTRYLCSNGILTEIGFNSVNCSEGVSKYIRHSLTQCLPDDNGAYTSYQCWGNVTTPVHDASVLALISYSDDSCAVPQFGQVYEDYTYSTCTANETVCTKDNDGTSHTVFCTNLSTEQDMLSEIVGSTPVSAIQSYWSGCDNVNYSQPFMLAFSFLNCMSSSSGHSYQYTCSSNGTSSLSHFDNPTCSGTPEDVDVQPSRGCTSDGLLYFNFCWPNVDDESTYAD